jgi:hypothetical protein
MFGCLPDGSQVQCSVACLTRQSGLMVGCCGLRVLFVTKWVLQMFNTKTYTMRKGLVLFFGILVGLLPVWQLVQAQVASYPQQPADRGVWDIATESAKIQAAYKAPAYLSFDVRYSHALEATPMVITDSVQGSIKLAGNQYWGILDSMEFMQNDRFAISVYKEGHLMGVDSPTALYPSAIPLTLLDSLVGKKGYTISQSVSGPNKVLSMRFLDPNMPYKDFTVKYDSSNYWIKQIVYTIRKDVYDADGSDELPNTDGGPAYVVITANYLNYSTAAFSATIFESERYFLASSGEYMPTTAFAGYDILVSSPGLLKKIL